MDQNHKNTKHTGAIMLIIGWIITIVVVTMLLQNTLYQEPSATFNKYNNTITIPKSNDGHFRVQGSINSVPVIFLLDTGASRVAIPQHIAKKAQLPQQQQIASYTAAGIATAYSTRIDHMSISKINFQNISAVILPEMHSNEVLLGMNVLKYFKITTEDNLLVMVK